MDRDGTPLEISLHLIEPEGETPRFLSIYRDISERKKVEIAKSEFVSTVSHELRTPLAIIRSSLDNLAMTRSDADPGNIYQQRARQGVERLETIIKRAQGR